MKRLKNSISSTFLVFVLLSMIAISLGSARAATLKVGEPFPNLQFPSVDGAQPQSIRDFAGEKVLLHIFASW